MCICDEMMALSLAAASLPKSIHSVNPAVIFSSVPFVVEMDDGIEFGRSQLA